MAERMQRWVVSGPTGAGKSLLVRLLARKGAAVICGDAIGHEVLRHPEIVDAVRETFGEAVITRGEVDRSALGRLVFGDAQALEQLCAITHPLLAARIRESFAALAAAGQTGLAVLEAAVYFLLPSLGEIDLVISVVAAADLRRKRLMAAGRLSAEEASRRIAAQDPLEESWTRSDVVLVNEGSATELAQQAQTVLGSHWKGIGEGWDQIDS